ncbi:MAG: Ycf48-like protein [bacterium]|nr:Ycf48-like protein [bacterium]
MTPQKIFSRLVMSLLLITVSKAAFSQGNFWEPASGPFRTPVSSFGFNSQGHIFAGTSGQGIFRSADNGITWNSLKTGLTGSYINCMTITPSGQLLTGTDGGTFRSTNNGESWKSISSKSANYLVVDAQGQIFAATGEGVARSKNNGDLWETSLLMPPYPRAVLTLALNANGEVFAGERAGLFRSANGGVSWTSTSLNTWIEAIVVDSPGTLYVGTYDADGNGDGGVFRSIDNGNTWTLINSGLPIQPPAVVGELIKNSRGHLFAAQVNGGGIFRSTDRGDHWTLINPKVIEVLGINTKDEIFAGTHDGQIWRSTDNGDNWAIISTGLAGGALAIAINTKEHIFTDGVGGLYESTDGGDNWRLKKNSGLPVDRGIRSLAINSSGQIFAGTNYAGVFRSDDNGDSWTATDTSLLHTEINSLAINSQGHLFAGAGFGIFRSTNNGDKWTLLENNVSVNILAINLQGDIFAGTSGNAGIFRSTDNGAHWTQINTGLTDRRIQALAINSNGHIFAGTYAGGVFRSTNNGDSWTLIDTGLNHKLIFALTINSREHIFAGTYRGGVYRSQDNGEHWVQINSGLNYLDVLSVWAFAIDASGHIFAKTGFGVFRSVETTTSVKETASEKPVTFALEQNYSNPFNPSTAIQFSLARSGFVTLKVYNTLGEELATLVSENLAAGKHQVQWNAAGIAAGIYFYRLQIGAAAETKKLIVLKKN